MKEFTTMAAVIPVAIVEMLGKRSERAHGPFFRRTARASRRRCASLRAAEAGKMFREVVSRAKTDRVQQ
jgi:hypothetical protein